MGLTRWSLAGLGGWQLVLDVAIAPVQTFGNRIPVQDFPLFIFCCIEFWIILPEGIDDLINLLRMRYLYFSGCRASFIFGNGDFWWPFWQPTFPSASFIYHIR